MLPWDTWQTTKTRVWNGKFNLLPQGPISRPTSPSPRLPPFGKRCVLTRTEIYLLLKCSRVLSLRRILNSFNCFFFSRMPKGRASDHIERNVCHHCRSIWFYDIHLHRYMHDSENKSEILTNNLWCQETVETVTICTSKMPSELFALILCWHNYHADSFTTHFHYCLRRSFLYFC